MSNFELSASDSKLLDAASNDVWRDSENVDWTQDDLPLPLLTVWAIEKGQGIIDNGGFQFFFEADWPDNPPYSVFIAAFERIGATETAALLTEAVDMFPQPNPELDHEMRNEFMATLPRDADGNSIFDVKVSRVWDLSDENFRLLANYVRVNLAFFPEAEKLEKGETT